MNRQLTLLTAKFLLSPEECLAIENYSIIPRVWSFVDQLARRTTMLKAFQFAIDADNRDMVKWLECGYSLGIELTLGYLCIHLAIHNRFPLCSAVIDASALPGALFDLLLEGAVRMSNRRIIRWVFRVHGVWDLSFCMLADSYSNGEILDWLKESGLCDCTGEYHPD
ncbi:MAG: hypothetical protein KGL39_10555 [Patescibacteria group bacterium]|nr:hypothetical protein [Patescibacteria group bacterium]